MPPSTLPAELPKEFRRRSVYAASLAQMVPAGLEPGEGFGGATNDAYLQHSVAELAAEEAPAVEPLEGASPEPAQPQAAAKAATR